MVSAVNVLVLVAAATFSFSLIASAGTTPEQCCTTELAPGATPPFTPDKCASAGLFKSESLCFTNSATNARVDRCDYYRCQRCGTTWCMARLKCSQPCLPYSNNGVCDCWNYFNAATSTCTAMPPATIENCTTATTPTTTTPPPPA